MGTSNLKKNVLVLSLGREFEPGSAFAGLATLGTSGSGNS